MRYMTSGHSHGKQITIVLEGIPSNLEIDMKKINQVLSKRQMGYGRGKRMNIESDEAMILSGVLFGKTTGAPIAIVIENKDYKNHKDYMDPLKKKPENYQPISVPRPGHADLVGALKYQQDDMRVIFERASARETVARVVVGSICQQILEKIDVSSLSYVTNIGGIKIEEINLSALGNSPVRMPCHNSSMKAMKKIDEAKLNKDTLGGICQVEVHHLPPGIGTYVASDQKLDALIASQLLSIQACKGVEFGDGFALADHFGSEVHDEIIYKEEFKRNSNHYGGFEGGMTTGMPVVVRAVFKPIPTLMSPLRSVNIKTKAAVKSHIERSDVCILPAASIICEYAVLYEITKALFKQFTSDTMEQFINAVNDYRETIKRF